MWKNKPYLWKDLSFGLATDPRVFTTNTHFIPCWCVGFHIIIYLCGILVLVFSKHAGQRALSFFCSTLVHPGLCIKHSKSELWFNEHFWFLALFWDTVDMFVSLPSDKCLEIWQLAHSFLQTQPVTVWQVMSFYKTNFCTSRYTQQCQLLCVIQRICWMFVILRLTYFIFFLFLSPFQLCISVRNCFNKRPVSLEFFLLDVVNTRNATSNHRTVIFEILGYHSLLVEPGQILCIRFI